MKDLLRPGLLFGLHMFYYAFVELLINDLAVAAVGVENVVILYGAISVAVAGGFLLFPLLRRLFIGSMTQKFLLIAAWVLNLAAFVVVLTVFSPSIFSLAAVFVTLTAGYIGGFVFYTIAAGPANKAYFGRMFGISSAVAFSTQFGCAKLITTFGNAGFWIEALVIEIALSICSVLLLLFFGRLPFQAIKNKASASLQQKNMGKYLWGVFFIITIIWAMGGMIDGVVTGLHAEQVLNVSDFPRLLYAVSLVIAGFLFDYKDGRIYAPVTMLSMIAQVIVVFIFTSSGGFSAALGAIYLCAAFGNIYSLAALTLSATSSENPALWAVMGRVMKYIPNGLMSVIGGYFYSTNANTIFTIIYIALLGSLFMLFFFQGKLSVQRIAPVLPDRSQTLDEMIADCGITERESETLKLLLSGKSTSEIAQTMFITEKTVQKYIGSMMAKTGTKSRSALITVFKS